MVCFVDCFCCRFVWGFFFLCIPCILLKCLFFFPNYFYFGVLGKKGLTLSFSVPLCASCLFISSSHNMFQLKLEISLVSRLVRDFADRGSRGHLVLRFPSSAVSARCQCCCLWGCPVNWGGKLVQLAVLLLPRCLCWCGGRD